MQSILRLLQIFTILSSLAAFRPNAASTGRLTGKPFAQVPNHGVDSKSQSSRAINEINGLFRSTASLLLGFTAYASSVNAYGELPVEKKTKKDVKPKVKETENGIKYIDVKVGSGPFPGKGDIVVINYVALLSNGTIFDELHEKKPLAFRYGAKEMIPGVEEVLYTMQPGGERTCTIPPKYAYGSKGVCIQGNGCLVPPDETIKYVIKLKSVAPSYN